MQIELDRQIPGPGANYEEEENTETEIPREVTEETGASTKTKQRKPTNQVTPQKQGSPRSRIPDLLPFLGTLIPGPRVTAEPEPVIMEPETETGESRIPDLLPFPGTLIPDLRVTAEPEPVIMEPETEAGEIYEDTASEEEEGELPNTPPNSPGQLSAPQVEQILQQTTQEYEEPSSGEDVEVNVNRETPFESEGEQNNNKKEKTQAFIPYTEYTKDETGKRVKILVTVPPRRMPPRLLELATEVEDSVTTNEPSSVNVNLEDPATLRGGKKNPKKRQRSQITYDDTPKRPNIRDRLGPRSDIRNRLGNLPGNLPANIRDRLGPANKTSNPQDQQDRTNPWQVWAQSSPWQAYTKEALNQYTSNQQWIPGQPWAQGHEPRCNTAWNDQIRARMMTFFGQESNTEWQNQIRNNMESFFGSHAPQGARVPQEDEGIHSDNSFETLDDWRATSGETDREEEDDENHEKHDDQN